MIRSRVPPSGGSLEIGNHTWVFFIPEEGRFRVPPSGGSLEIGNMLCRSVGISLWLGCSPFGGIPRNWKRLHYWMSYPVGEYDVPPSGGSLEIGNSYWTTHTSKCDLVPPSGGSLEIGNRLLSSYSTSAPSNVPPSGGSLEIGNEGLT